MHITVSVIAGARKESVEQVSPTRLKIAVREEAEQNAANRRVVELVAEHFEVSTKQVQIIKGHHSPSKLLEIRSA